MRAIAIGHVCIDKNTSEQSNFVGAGGPGVFMNKVMSGLPGSSFAVCAPYGPDFLQYQGALSLFPSKPLEISTLVYENTVTHGIRTQKCYHHETAVPITLTGEMKNIIKIASVVCVAPLTPAYSPQYIRDVKKIMSTTSPMVLLPQGCFRQFDVDHTVVEREFIETESILPLVDVVIVSDEDHSDMNKHAQYWAKTYGCLVVMTQADRGATVFNGKNQTSVPTNPVPMNQIVSSIGAGDIFSAGFMYEFYSSHDAISAARYGNRLARQGLLCAPDALVFSNI